MGTEETIDQKKKYICTYARKLSKEDRIDVGKSIQRGGFGNKLKYGADGARINLDDLGEHTDSIVNRIYFQIKHKIDKQESSTAARR